MSAPSSTTTQGTNESPDLWLLGVLLAVIGAGFVLWLGAQLASIVHSHHHLAIDDHGRSRPPGLPPGTGDPRLAFDEPARSQLPGPILFWICVALAVTACVP